MNKDIEFRKEEVEEFATFIAVMERQQIAYHVFDESTKWKVRILHAKV
jgi:hypothetical protein